MFHSKMTATSIRDTLRYAKKGKNILFVGICGVGMSALARMLHQRGYGILGYDKEKGGEYARLRREKIPVFHSCEQIDLSSVCLIVYTLAIEDHHPLIRHEIPECSRAQLLGAMMLDYHIRIAVSGAHGKSTVTSLLHRALLSLGEEPTTLSGADLGDGDGPLYIGKTRIFLYECCEYKNSFLYTFPTHALVLNIDLDHTDFFPSLDALKHAFLTFMHKAQTVLYFQNDCDIPDGNERLPDGAIGYTLKQSHTQKHDTVPYLATVDKKTQDRYTYSFYLNGVRCATLTPMLSGLVGVYNTLASLVLLTHLGYDPHRCAQILETLSPIARRMEFLGMLSERAVYYDFAHHPTEIRASLVQLTERYGTPPTVIFAPHTYTRTRDFWDGFVDAFSLAHTVCLAPIYPAREMPIPGVTSERLAQAIGRHAYPLRDLEDTLKYLECGEGPIVLLGAGNLTEIKEKITKMKIFVSKSSQKLEQ